MKKQIKKVIPVVGAIGSVGAITSCTTVNVEPTPAPHIFPLILLEPYKLV